MKKQIINFIIIFFIGGLGGFFFSNVLLPKLSFFDGGWGADLIDRTVIVNKTEEINVQESDILNEVIEKNKSSIATIKLFKNNNLISLGSGFIVSSDGLIITRREVILGGYDKISVDVFGETFSARVLKKMDDYGLVLLESDAKDMPIVSFYDFSKGNLLGNRVILLGNKKGNSGDIPFVNSGIIKSVDGDLIETTIKEESSLVSGTPLLNLKGDILGINFTNSKGYVFAVKASIIKSFIFN